MDWHYKHLIGAKILDGSSVFHDGFDELIIQTVDGQIYKFEAAERNKVNYIAIIKKA